MDRHNRRPLSLSVRHYLWSHTMWITHSYLGSTRGKMRYLFFLLYEDYIDAQTQFAQELDLFLERFARNLGDGVLLFDRLWGS